MKITVGNYYKRKSETGRQFTVKAVSNEKVYQAEEVFDGVEIDFKGNEISCTYKANCFTELTHEEVRVLENNLLTSKLIKSQDEKSKENPNRYKDYGHSVMLTRTMIEKGLSFTLETIEDNLTITWLYKESHFRPFSLFFTKDKPKVKKDKVIQVVVLAKNEKDSEIMYKLLKKFSNSIFI
jgi:hypothetical protein